MLPIRLPAPIPLASALLTSVLAGPPVDDRADLAQYALVSRGDVNRGRALFADGRRAGCARCHKVDGRGGELGPDLSSIGAKFAREHLIESVLDPSRQVV